MEKLDLKRLNKKVLPMQSRPKVSNAKAAEPFQKVMHINPNTPTADELQTPPIPDGAGNSYDVTPYLTVKDLPYNWLDLMKKEAMIGRGPTSYARALGITRAGLETLLVTSPEFAEAFDRCNLLSAEWWEDRGRDMAENGNGTVWIANMVNRWGWNSNKQETTAKVSATTKATVTSDLSKEELDKELERRGLSLKVFDESL